MRAQNRNREQDFSKNTWRSAAALAVSTALFVAYFQYEKFNASVQREMQQNAQVGRPLVGGPFSLVDHHGRPVTDQDFRGKWMLVYFGYTFCPDVCPEELEKMGTVIDAITAAEGEASINSSSANDDVAQYQHAPLVPLFISCDPKRDSIASIKEYLAQFHPTFLGLTGTHGQIKRVAKAYRLYYSAPPKAVDDDETDYLVDHSIFFYLMDPEGKYVFHFGRNETAEDVVARITAARQAYASYAVDEAKKAAPART
ncbi:hypothetical protein CXG81DRAFT_29704 [Caulochytrium protostelioides]|uniref:Thioredoxin domain-containing protein n=1 Tax=Caulochytrium protostelioides TaxID=1555241 RepID=A0A4P9X8L4_9FUNG|nr:hypothetical protein CXG81DRAFT_29704 [Caulochytrium protostelioides]|eukprot:RKP01644.1 hypothetical protein CXG81DRAFT_29704 [Caulochytrium protostelioides]